MTTGLLYRLGNDLTLRPTEAATGSFNPLIVSNNIQTPVEKYIVAAEIIDYLNVVVHYTVEEKNKNLLSYNLNYKMLCIQNWKILCVLIRVKKSTFIWYDIKNVTVVAMRKSSDI